MNSIEKALAINYEDVPEPVLGEVFQQYANLGTVIAWGWVDALYEGEEFSRWCILTLLPDEFRIPNVANYAVSYYYPHAIPDNVFSNRIEAFYTYGNIVPAVRCYEEMGMDY